MQSPLSRFQPSSTLALDPRITIFRAIADPERPVHPPFAALRREPASQSPSRRPGASSEPDRGRSSSAWAPRIARSSSEERRRQPMRTPLARSDEKTRCMRLTRWRDFRHVRVGRRGLAYNAPIPSSAQQGESAASRRAASETRATETIPRQKGWISSCKDDGISRMEVRIAVHPMFRGGGNRDATERPWGSESQLLRSQVVEVGRGVSDAARVCAESRSRRRQNERFEFHPPRRAA